MREYYRKHHIASDVRQLTGYLATENQRDKKEATKLVFELFPYGYVKQGYVKQACKIVGMEKSRPWSTA